MHKKTFEVALTGFDGSTDKTDDLIRWVHAKNKAQVRTVLKRKGISYKSISELPFLNGPSPEWIDFDFTVYIDNEIKLNKLGRKNKFDKEKIKAISLVLFGFGVFVIALVDTVLRYQ